MTSGVIAPLGAMFRHVQSATPDASEILVLTFNHDLAFFEKVALGTAQLTGARITVVADASMAHHDVYAVRRAGTAYLPGLAQCRGSFHPKLVVVASPDRTTVGIGSGNLSMAGWQGNDELWSWHHATTDGGAAVVPATGAWLRALADAVTLAAPVADALRRIGDGLARFDAIDGESRLVDTVSGPLLEQLPEGPVDELNVYAPFYDPNAAALAALVERFKPSVLRVAYQPTMTHINGAATARLIGAAGEVRELPQERYRHGKLIEWAIGAERWALTGSANISTSALLKAVADGGNVELGVISPVTQSLLPEGTFASASHLAAVSYRGMPPTSGPITVILAATRGPAGVEVVFGRPLRVVGILQVSEAQWPPDQWEPVGEVAEHQVDALVRDAPGGSRLRVRFADGSTSSVAWVTDLERVQRVRDAVRAGPKPPELGEVFSDVGAAEKFFQLNLERQQKAGPAIPFTTSSAGGASGSAKVEGWEEYLDRCAGRVGAYTFAFSFGLPLPSRQLDPSVNVRIVDWDDDVLDDDAEALEGDTADDTTIDEDRGLIAPQLANAQEKVRARFRRFARRMIHDWIAPDPQERLLALRSALLLVAGGAWDHTDEDWRPLVLDGIERLAIDEMNEDYTTAAASLGLLGLSLVGSSLSRWERGPAEIRYDRVLDRLAGLVIEADPQRIADYADGLAGRFPVSTRPDVVMQIVERLTTFDGLDNVVDDLAERGFAATRDGRVIELIKRVQDPLLPALWALTVASKSAPVAICCASPSGRFVNVIWRPPDVIVIDSPKPGALWARHYRYPAGGDPGGDVRLNHRLSSDRCIATTTVNDPLPEIASELLRSVGLDEPYPLSTTRSE
ncbi:MAG: hypothetical protein JWR83_1609 [Aeromicrobium sp.]|nr:hypothetical protein [Aeromicrobium sp.]